MNDAGTWSKRKRGRRPKGETVADRIFAAHQEKLRQAERNEPLSEFDQAAIVKGLWRTKGAKI